MGLRSERGWWVYGREEGSEVATDERSPTDPRPFLPFQVLDMLRLRELYGLAHAGLPLGFKSEAKELSTLLHYLFPEDTPRLLSSYFGSSFRDSAILTSAAHRSALATFLPPSLGEPRLLYRGTRDGWHARYFHSKCQNCGPNVVIVKSKENSVFGGYTSLSWSRPREASNEGACAETFLFSLSNPTNHPPCKLPIKEERRRSAIYRSRTGGPCFGVGGLRLGCAETYLHILESKLSRTGPFTLPEDIACPARHFLMGATDRSATEVEVYGFSG